jgi:purine catabolism regulator
VPTTLRGMLGHDEFRLRLMAGADNDDPALDVPVTWAHSSDLKDPTPWLEPGQVLLTDGVQFADDAELRHDGDFTSDYVRRLRTRGVLALGFATGIAHDTIPPELVAACDHQKLPLFEVDAKTPFIGVIRYVADVIAEDRRARLEWSLDAQRAVARAALRPDGLQAILVELSRRLDCWVSLYDSARNPLTVPGLESAPQHLRSEIDSAVAGALSRGARAGLRIQEHSGGITLQTLGQRGQLLGVLVVGAAAPLDPAGNDLMSSVIGLASIALEQRRTLDEARRQLRTGLFELLLSGVVDVADRTAASLWGALPEEPVRLSVVAGTIDGQSLFDELELHASHNEGRLFYAERADEVVLVTHGEDAEAMNVLRRHGLGAGTSAPVRWIELPRALSEARRAARSVTREVPFVGFEDLAGQGMQGLLASAGGAVVARRILEPVLQLPEREREAMLETLLVWLQHNGAWDPAARELGVHRHTLRNRVSAADALLGIDLDTFGARAELWAALQLLD